MEGIYNAVAPEHITNAEATKLLATSLNKRIWLPNVPAVVMQMLYGQMSTLMLKGNKVSSEKIEDTGFDFKYRELKECL